MKYSDYVREDNHTLFVSVDPENDGVHFLITFGDGIIRYEQTLTPNNARMLAHYLEQHAAKLKP